ncbi:hypothetical protein SteCoe_9304 [Stentor coeruleus]|uniref:Uncharacterized protein n=1 Tax=Stentor coeruleus TaxID=5963 RepID=A0A1R2CIA4_9CILI|nr:hypothetical protein SteCoe_9304 [Stentor coeruleus]
MRKIDHIHVFGVINYLPLPLQIFFTEISIFDVLCNLWFVPRITLYIKRLFLPFFVKITREEAYYLFHELNPEVALKLDTKGVVNILPENFAKALLPKNSSITRLISSTDEDINLISYDENGIRLKKQKTQLISSGFRRNNVLTSHINQKISDITSKILTLEPFFGKILGNQFRQLMAFFSPKVLAMSSIIAGWGILLQIYFSKYARKWLATGLKFSIFTCSFALLALSLFGLAIKFIHNKIGEPKKEENDQFPKIFKEIRQIKSRFNSKADKNSFFSPELKMAS